MRRREKSPRLCGPQQIIMGSMILMSLVGVLSVGGMAIAAQGVGAESPSEHTFSLRVSSSQIWLAPSGAFVDGYFPGATELLVRVRNDQGKPVDDVPVGFRVAPEWVGDASVVPGRAVTRHGIARAVFRAERTGVVRVMARVGNTTKATTIAVSAAPSPSATD